MTPDSQLLACPRCGETRRADGWMHRPADGRPICERCSSRSVVYEFPVPVAASVVTGTDPGAGDDRTVAMVELRELTDLARLVRAMRRAQAAYFEARRGGRSADAEFRAARQYEGKVDAAVKRALAREVQSLPGMDD
ncbi:MAG: hypothetical protein K2X91_03645 [Thermoleophilia bacterium]|nr:hypothetical protein [Thermoleophilia bacterium]